MDIWERNARESIRHTLALYHAGGDSGDYDLLGSAFSEDGILVRGNPGMVLVGREEIVTALKARVLQRGRQGEAGCFQRHHLTSSHVESISPMEAVVTSYFLVITELGPDHAGIYADRFAKVGDCWLIARRQAKKDWIRPDSRFAVGA